MRIICRELWNGWARPPLVKIKVTSQSSSFKWKRVFIFFFGLWRVEAEIGAAFIKFAVVTKELSALLRTLVSLLMIIITRFFSFAY